MYLVGDCPEPAWLRKSCKLPSRRRTFSVLLRRDTMQRNSLDKCSDLIYSSFRREKVLTESQNSTIRYFANCHEKPALSGSDWPKGVLLLSDLLTTAMIAIGTFIIRIISREQQPPPLLYCPVESIVSDRLMSQNRMLEGFSSFFSLSILILPSKFYTRHCGR